MLTTLELRLPWGRFHATPWDRNSNEGAVEWPPSPWRLLRALYATWSNRALGEVDESIVASLLAHLAVAPSYLLPEHQLGSTRHWYPDATSGVPVRQERAGKIEWSIRRTDKILDGFAATARNDPLLVRWPVDLDGAERDALSLLAERLTYLGRAESLCIAQFLHGDEVPPELVSAQWWQPVKGASGHRARARVLCPKLPFKLDALLERPTDQRRAKRLLPKGAHWQEYEVGAPPTPLTVARRPSRTSPTALRWAVSAPALPALIGAVAVADVFRKAALRRYSHLHGERPAPALLVGKDLEGRKLEGHQHAHHLCLDLDRDGLIDTLVLWIPGGVDADVLRASAWLERLRGFGHVPEFRPVRLALEAHGQVERVVEELYGPARVWRSHTPFAPPRHRKRGQDDHDYLAAQVREELERRGRPSPAEVRLLTVAEAGIPPLAFRRHRVDERLRTDTRRAVALELRFDEQVEGPLPLGALSHFGLGLFLPHER